MRSKYIFNCKKFILSISLPILFFRSLINLTALNLFGPLLNALVVIVSGFYTRRSSSRFCRSRRINFFPASLSPLQNFLRKNFRRCLAHSPETVSWPFRLCATFKNRFLNYTRPRITRVKFRDSYEGHLDSCGYPKFQR